MNSSKIIKLIFIWLLIGIGSFFGLIILRSALIVIFENTKNVYFNLFMAILRILNIVIPFFIIFIGTPIRIIIGLVQNKENKS